MGAIGHMLIFLQLGTLPWIGVKIDDPAKKEARIGEIKESEGIEKLCAKVPEEYANFLRYARTLPFQERPDYDRLRQLIRKARERATEQTGTSQEYDLQWLKATDGFDPQSL